MIINADDYCLNENVTKAIKKCFELGIIDRTSCLVNTDLFTEIISDDFSKSILDKIGLHLNLTEGKPLTKEILECSKFVDSDGFFVNNISNRKGKRIFFLSKKEKNALKHEIEAQFSKFRLFNKEAIFFDSHHNIHTVYSIFKLIEPIAIKFGFKSTRISKNVYKVKRNVFIRIYKKFINRTISKNFETTKFFGSCNDFRICYNQKTDEAEIMCHPGFLNKELIDLSSKFNMIEYKKMFKHEN